MRWSDWTIQQLVTSSAHALMWKKNQEWESLTCSSPPVPCWPSSWTWAEAAAAALWQPLCLWARCSRWKSGMWCSRQCGGPAAAGFWLYRPGWSFDLRRETKCSSAMFFTDTSLHWLYGWLTGSELLTANICVEVADSEAVFAFWTPGNTLGHQVESAILLPLADLLHHQQHLLW